MPSVFCEWIISMREHPKVLTFCFTRVVFSVSSSPFLLNVTIRHHLKRCNDIHPEFCAEVSKVSVC